MKTPKCRGCGSWCAIPGCDVCLGRKVCLRCEASGLKIVDGRLAPSPRVAELPANPPKVNP